MLSASHRLHSEALSAAGNRAAYGKCNNPHGHGHNYIVEVMVAGPVDEATGMVMNMADLDRAVKTEVLDRFDHANLNLDSLFAAQVSTQVPTTENFCRAVYNLLRLALPEGMLDQVRIEETENNFFEYRGA
jgi:6-pyruvoyltetrahydropterin/6-carboxytetrahydropterin synthase